MRDHINDYEVNCRPLPNGNMLVSLQHRSTKMTDIHPNRYEQSPTEQDDLPEELKAQLRREPKGTLESNLAQLFEDGEQRTINDVLVDYWYAHKEVIKRPTMIQTLAAMAKKGYGVRRAGKGVYVAKDAGMPVQAHPPMPAAPKADRVEPQRPVAGPGDNLPAAPKVDRIEQLKRLIAETREEMAYADNQSQDKMRIRRYETELKRLEQESAQ